MAAIKSIKVGETTYDLKATYDGAGNVIDMAYAKTDAVPTKISQLQNDSGYLTEHQDISGLATKDELNNKVNKENNKSLVDNNLITKLQSLNTQEEITQSISNVSSIIQTHIGSSNNPHQVTKEQIGLENVDNTSDADKPVSTATQAALDNKVDIELGKQLSTEDYSTLEKEKLASIEAEANKYVHPNTSGNKHIPAGGASGQILTFSEDGTAQWADTSTKLEEQFNILNAAWGELQKEQQNLSKQVAELNSNVDLYSYGVEWDVTVASPELTRIGNPLLHKSLPIQSAYRGCIANNSVVNYYLYPDNWAYKEDGSTPSVLDGTDGTVRVNTPKFYGRSGSNGNKRWVRISLVKIDDSWVEIPEMLIDAYRCTVNQSTNKAESVANTTANYRGGGNRAQFDKYLTTELDTKDIFRSDLGKPRTNVSRATMRTYAKNAGSELLCYEYYKWIFYWNYVIEYANFNSQDTYNAELTSDGYRQGGLGPGVTQVDNTKWNIYNGRYPLTPCGFCNNIGNFTGIKEQPVSAAITTNLTTSLSSYSKDAAGGTATNSGTSIIISKVSKANNRILHCQWDLQSGITVYNISGLNSGQSIIFYTNNTTIATATQDGEITVDWGTSQSERQIRASIVESECSITMSIVSASQETLTMSLGTLKVPRWRGFDNPFGDIWTNLDGIVIKRDTAGAISRVYTTTNKEEFTDAIGNKTIAGYEVAQDRFIKEFALGETAEIIPSSCTGASTTTYICDYHWYSSGSTSLRTLRVGGNATTGGSSGLGSFNSYNAVSSVAFDVGFRTLNRVS